MCHETFIEQIRKNTCPGNQGKISTCPGNQGNIYMPWKPGKLCVYIYIHIKSYNTFHEMLNEQKEKHKHALEP